MLFRPYPILTLLAAPVLGVLIWLGMWQADRAGWKAKLIADFEAAATAEPQPADSVVCGDASAEGRIVLRPQTDGPVLRVFGQSAAGATGWRLFQAADICGGDAILVQTGFEALTIGDLPPPREAAPTGRYMVDDLPERGFMAAPNLPERNEWHVFDAPAMAAALGVAAIDQRYILTPFDGLPDYLVRTPPARHVGYSATWFGMAAALVLLYAAFHARAGRLRFRKPDSDAR